ncbi:MULTISPECIES: aldo/keto reductase [unclassified Flavobacterium]|uniref:aldo/keto reductase n=1 Tax=unclassified Flavobacterium TaxID=196869 RepID=UPI001F13ED7A|nr:MULTISPECIES: aldo/keto reductase [unclassified Flavobacterium]UMY66117.1 aldo/keto reductase [Flavobacterium sp. HJ-32-4]
MEKRQVGASDLEVYPVMLGGNVFGWTIDEARSFEILDGFVAAGFNFIDTADVYSRWAPGNSGGESETVIGNWLHKRKNRHDVVIATKVGFDMGDGKKGLRKACILKAADASLKRLRTDYIDLYQTHCDDESVPVGETLEAYDQLVKEGKVRWIGASNLSPERLKESLATSATNGFPSYQSLQPHYNLYDRQVYESRFETLAMGHGLGVVPYFSLAAGFLTGKYRSEADFSQSVRGGNMGKFLNERGFRILAALDKVAAELNTTQAALALAWLLHRPSVTAPIVSATSPEQLQSLIAAPLLEVTAGHIAELTSASAW